MSRQTSSSSNIIIMQHLLVPRPKSNTAVKTSLVHKRHAQKKCYDNSSRPLRPLVLSEVVRMQTHHGHDSLGTNKKSRSYIVQSGGGEYRRNRRHVLPVPEAPPQHGDSHDDSTVVQPSTACSPEHKENEIHGNYM